MDELPDFDDMMECIDAIFKLDIKISELKNGIKYKESVVMIVATTDEKYFVNNKPPSVSYLDATYRYTGFEDEIYPMRVELDKAEAELKMTENKLSALKLKIEIWRTESANKRHAVI